MQKKTGKLNYCAKVSIIAVILASSSMASSSDSSSVSASDSQASNSSFSAEVNSQTGQVSITLQVLKLSGVTSDMDIALSIKNSGINNCIYNLPSGWSMDIPFVDTVAGKVYPSPGENYIIDDTFESVEGYKSGLRYYTSKDIKFTQGYGTFQGTEYYYKLEKLDGTKRYFDFNGKYLGFEDRFGNYITLSYTQVNSGKDFTAYNAQLSQIRDSYGQTIKFSASGSAENWSITYTTTMPDGRTATADCQDNVLTITSTTGRVTKATFKDGHLAQIDYDTGGRDTYEWSDSAIPYSYNNLSSTGYISAVTQVTKDPSPGNSNSGDEMVTQYNYCVEGNNNYTGYGIVDFGSGTSKDALMESQERGYDYTTSTTQVRSSANDGNVTAKTTYNFLHLPTVTSSSKGESTLMQSTYTYHGQTDNGSFPKNVSALNCIYSKTKEVADYYYGGASTREHRVLTMYDDWGNNTSMTEYNNGSVTSITAKTYDNNNYGQVLSQTLTDKIDGKTTYQTSSLSSDGKYIASSTTTLSGDSSNGKTILMSADSKGRQTGSTAKFASGGANSNGNPTESASNTSYSLSGTSLIQTSTDALGYSSSQKADIGNGNVLKQTDANGNSVKYTYESNGMIATKTYPDGKWEKTDGTNPNKTIVTTSGGKVTTSYLDGYGRTYKQTDNLGSNGSERVIGTVDYNELGKKASETDMYSHTTTYNYDWQGRQIYSKDYLGNETKAEYNDANKYYDTYYNGIKVSTSYYDDNGNTTSQISYLGGNSNSSKVPLTTVKYNGKEQEIESAVALSEGSSTSGTNIMSSTSDYDSDGNLIQANVSTNDGIIASSSYTLSLFGDIVSRSTEFTSVGTSGFDKTGALPSDQKFYDANGNLIKYVSKGGKTTTYSYDGNGKMISMTDPAGKTITYAYGSMGNMIKMATPTYILTNEYYGSGTGKSEGQIKSKTLSSSSGGAIDKISYGYDSGNGQINSIIYNDGKKMTASYDNYGRVTSITDFAGIETTITYDSSIPTNITKVSNKYGYVTYSYYTKSDNALFGGNNTVKQITYSNGVKVQYQYNIVGNKTPQLSMIVTLNSEGKVLNSAAYEYDDQNRITMMRQKSDVDADNTNSNNIKNFTYDGFDHLVKEEVTKLNGTVIITTTFKYDLNGNIINKVIATAD